MALGDCSAVEPIDIYSRDTNSAAAHDDHCKDQSDQSNSVWLIVLKGIHHLHPGVSSKYKEIKESSQPSMINT